MGLRRRIAALGHEINPDISIHDFRMVSGETHTNLIFDAVVPYQLKLTDQEVLQQFQEKITAALGEHYRCVIKIDKPLT